MGGGVGLSEEVGYVEAGVGDDVESCLRCWLEWWLDRRGKREEMVQGVESVVTEAQVCRRSARVLIFAAGERQWRESPLRPACRWLALRVGQTVASRGEPVGVSRGDSEIAGRGEGIGRPQAVAAVVT